MAELVGVFASSHGPMIVRNWPTLAPAAKDSLTVGFTELGRRIKAARPDVPVIMITAYGDADTKRRALENGAEALLTKPIDFGVLRSEIDRRVDRAA